MADCNSSENFYGSQDIEAASTTKKYGGLAPKKKPLISKDHERAFFDSADWALCKQGAGVNQKSTVAIETLRPKLQRTPHHPLPPRRPACTSGSNVSLDVDALKKSNSVSSPKRLFHRKGACLVEIGLRYIIPLPVREVYAKRGSQCDERGSKGFQSDAEVFLPTLLLLQMLLERGLKLTFSLIIDGLCQAQQVDDALVCFSEMVEWGISLNAVTHNLLIRYLCVRGDAARSMKPLLDMQKHGKSLDILSAFLVGVSIFCCNLGKADEDGSQTGTGIAGGMPQTGTGIVDGDPAEVVAKALLCFNNKYVSGILILSTHGRIHAVEYVEICNFDVSEHLQAEQNNAYNTANQILLGLGFMFAEPALLLLYYDVCNLWLEVSCFQRDISQLRCSEGGDKRYFSLA
ncbi:hypothetical protein NC653_025487 [Populus alba x Populus x berolinensis]|uniref:Uncharacterized protein n=2 Tax=Populus TaxID=3689 RepID=A0AAD6MBQ0_9ROSI|nr:hypothetical protein NC653_025487 [Populus alba x Populus x berolinensis]